MADSKTIQMIFAAKDLASKPVREISAGVDGLVKKIESLVPASERGEGSVGQLVKVAEQLSKAGAGLAADQSIIESYQLLNAKLDEASKKFVTLKERADAAKLALSKTSNVDTRRDATGADRAVAQQQNVLNRLNGQLATVSQKAERAGLDLRNIAAAEAEIAGVVAKTEQAYVRVNKAIESHEGNVERAGVKARELSEGQARAAAIYAKTQEDSNRRTREGIALLDAAVAKKKSEEADLTRATAARQKSADAFWAEVRAAEAKRNALTATVVAEREAANAQRASADIAAATRAREANARAAQVISQRAVATEEQRIAGIQAVKQKHVERLAAAQAFLTERERAWTAAAQQGITVATRSAAAVRSLGDAYGQAAPKARSLFSIITGADQTGERRALSTFQRIRGQVLSLTAGYVGLFGAINAVKGVLDVVNKRTAVENTLKVGFGVDAAKEMQYVEAQADRLGKKVFELASSYASFALATKGANVSQRDTRFIFEAITEASTVMNKSTQDTQLIFKALEQVFSKNKLTMEELSGQLSENFPGAMAILAQATGKSQAELFKWIGTGKAGADALIDFAKVAREKFAPAVATSTQSTQSQLSRLDNVITKLKLTIADSGFIQKFTAFIADLTEKLKSPEGQKFGESIAVAFGLAVDALKFFIDNLKIFATIFAITLGVKAIQMVANLRTQLILLGESQAVLAMVSKFKQFNASVETGLKGLGTFSRTLVGGLALAQAAMSGWDIGKWLYASFPAVQKWSQVIVGYVSLAVNKIRATWLKYMPRWLGGGSQDEIAAAKRAIQADIDTINGLLKNQFTGAKASGAAAPAASSAGDTTAFDEAAAEERRKRRAAEAAAAAETLSNKQNLQSRIDSLNAESLKKEASNADEFAAAIKLQFKDLYADIEKFGKEHDKKTAARMKAQVDQVVKLRESQARAEFARNSVDTLSDTISGTNSRREAEISSVKERGRAKLLTDESVNAEIQNIQEKYRPELTSMIEDLLNQIARLPRKTQEELTALVLQMQNLRDIGLQEKPDQTEFLRIKQQAETVKLADKAHSDALKLQKELLRSHQITQREYNAEVDRLREQYGFVVTDSTALLEAIRSSTTLTEAQKLSLAGVAQGLQAISDKESQINEKKARYLTLATDASNALANALVPSGEMLEKIHNLGDAWINVRDTMRNYFADLLANKAKEIIAEQILNAIKAVGRAFGYSFHTGGVVGAGGAMRTVNPAWFASAPRYHTGGVAGVAGLGPREVPAVLERGEEVLKRNDPRHVMNGGGQGGGQQPMNVKIVNSIDSGSVLEQGAGTAAGERAILNVLRANASSIKNLLR